MAGSTGFEPATSGLTDQRHSLPTPSCCQDPRATFELSPARWPGVGSPIVAICSENAEGKRRVASGHFSPGQERRAHPLLEGEQVAGVSVRGRELNPCLVAVTFSPAISHHSPDGASPKCDGTKTR